MQSVRRRRRDFGIALGSVETFAPFLQSLGLIVVDDVPGEFAERVIESFHGRPNDGFSFCLSGGSTARRG